MLCFFLSPSSSLTSLSTFRMAFSSALYAASNSGSFLLWERKLSKSFVLGKIATFYVLHIRYTYFDKRKASCLGCAELVSRLLEVAYHGCGLVGTLGFLGTRCMCHTAGLDHGNQGLSSFWRLRSLLRTSRTAQWFGLLLRSWCSCGYQRQSFGKFKLISFHLFYPFLSSFSLFLSSISQFFR